MRSYNLTYSTQAISTLPIEKINAAQSILIQVFTTQTHQPVIERLLTILQDFFPTAVIIGTTTAGNIIGKRFKDNETVLSITTFDKSTLRLKHLKNVNHTESYQNGLYLANELVQKDTKALILFSDTKSTNGQALIDGIRSVSQEVVISGGKAASSHNTPSRLFSNSGISEEGIVAVSLSGETLSVENHYKNDWIPFGKKFLITHAEGKRVYTIDHMRAIDFFSHYLSDQVTKNFTETGTLFPIVKIEKGTIIARTATEVHEDGSIEFAAEIATGELYQFGFSDLEFMLQPESLPLQTLQHESESIFVYSCISRRKINLDAAMQEITPLTALSDVSGFFTCGEFYANAEGGYFMNHTLTMLSLSEKTTVHPSPKRAAPDSQKAHFTTLSALSHLIDVTNSELREYNLYLEEKDTLLKEGPVVNFKIDLEKGEGCTYISPNIERLLGYTPGDFTSGKITPDQIIEPQAMTKLLSDIEKFKYDDNDVYETDLKAYTKYGEEKHLHIVLTMDKTSRHGHNIYLGYCIDITRQVETEKKIRKLAFYDHITGLPNRELLKTTLQEKIDEALEHNKLCAVSFFDLDKFKDVNDTYGHSVGDKLLQLIANRVKSILKPDDFIARIGGDEFIMIHGNLNRQTIQNTILSTINRILTLIHEPFDIDGKIAHISTSIGTAIFGIDGTTVEDLIKHADMAMYEAKNDPNVHFKFYSHTMRLLREEELYLRNGLKEALEKREFYLLYQPQVDIHSGKIIGAEALIRWKHPQRGVISPVTFIPMAEEMNLITEIGEWILEEVCRRIKVLQSEYHLPESFRSIAVNISPIQFNDPNFVSKVEEIVNMFQINTSCLEFELTEGVFADNLAMIVEKMHRLKALGITISLDDFGTGYASLRYLKELPVDTIKIDRAFISNLDENREDQMLTSTIIQLSKNMQCKIIAEGVENIEQLQFLEKNQCQSYQGFYFSKPVPFEELEALLEREVADTTEA
ncbi:MAG: hypothetical protein DSZ05_04995 [Sulfurospirillum sp.]|nr:MAG: hypothetical protein DSZ05_04995 [Sulfurospirillum sp.]